MSFHDKVCFSIESLFVQLVLKTPCFQPLEAASKHPCTFVMLLQSPSLNASLVVLAELNQLFKSGLGTPFTLSAPQLQKKEFIPAPRSLLADVSMTPCLLNLLEASQTDAPLINISAAEELRTVQLP